MSGKRQKPRLPKRRNSARIKAGGKPREAAKKEQIVPHLENSSLPQFTPAQLRDMQCAKPIHPLPLAAVCKGIAKDCFDTLVTAGFDAAALSGWLCQGAPLYFAHAHEAKPRAHRVLLSGRERQSAVKKGRDFLAIAQRICTPRDLQSIEALLARIDNAECRTIGGEDFFILQFLAEVRRRTGTWHYTQVAGLLDAVLTAMGEKDEKAARGAKDAVTCKRQDEICDENNLRNLVARWKVLLSPALRTRPKRGM